MLKSLTRRVLRGCGYSVAETSPWTELIPGRRDHLAFALAASFPSLSGLRLLQIGANDGVREDPVCDLIDRYGWHGVFVEGDPSMAEVLKRRRSDTARFRVVNTLISDRDGIAEFYSLKAEGLPDFARGLGTLSKERIKQAQRDLGSCRPEIVTRQLGCTTMRTFLSSVGREFDVGVIDVEGLDLSMLEWLRVENALPKVVFYEHKCLKLREAGESFDLLRDRGYNLLIDDSDCVAYRRQAAGV